MSERRSLALFEGPTLGVFDVRCSAPSGAPGPEERAEVTQIVLPVEGLFEVHTARETVIADATSAVVLAAGHEHRVGHPASGGDRSIVLVLPPDVVDDAFEHAGTHGGSVGARVHLGVRLLDAGLRRGALDELEAEELALLLLGTIGVELGPARSFRPPSRHQRERIEQVRGLLAAAPERRWRLAEIARAVHCSPFHLARQFRAVTGTSIAAYVLRLRLAAALLRLSEGEADLARLAADLGFATHSHFSSRFRSVFGQTPGSVRDSLSAGRVDQMRTFVTAPERAAS